MWSLNTIMGAGALGVEVVISGKSQISALTLKSIQLALYQRSGDSSEKIVRTGLTHVVTKMGLMGIQLRIASKVALPPEFELKSESEDVQASEAQPSPEACSIPPK